MVFSAKGASVELWLAVPRSQQDDIGLEYSGNALTHVNTTPAGKIHFIWLGLSPMLHPEDIPGKNQEKAFPIHKKT